MVKETTDIIYTIIDIETTGGKFNEEKITEIAIFKLSKNGNITKYHKLINPEKKIQPFVEKLTGLNNKMLENKNDDVKEASKIIKRYFSKDTQLFKE